MKELGGDRFSSLLFTNMTPLIVCTLSDIVVSDFSGDIGII
jgi:hypothetical protein